MMLPGSTALIVMPLAASSIAAVRRKPSCPALLAPQCAQPGHPVRGRGPAPANARAMRLPMPRVGPGTTTDRRAMDVNMLALPFPTAPRGALSVVDQRPPSAEPAEVGLGQVAAPGGVSGSELLCDLDGGVRADPGDEQQPAVEDERPDLGLVCGGQVQHSPGAAQAPAGQPRHLARPAHR